MPIPEEDGSPYFYPLLMLLWHWGGFFMPLLELQRPAGSLLGAFSEMISHSSPLASPSHPSAWLHSCLSGSSCLCAVHRLSFSHVSILSLSVGGSWLWRAPASLLFPRAGFSRAHLWSQVVCGWKNWSCLIFGFALKKTYLPWDLLLKNYQFSHQPTAFIFWIIDQLPRGPVVLQVEWDENSSPSHSDCIPSMVR